MTMAALSAVLAALLMTGGCRARSETAPPPATQKSPLGLMGTLPIYWGEADGPGDLLSGKVEPGWVRGALEARYTLAPLDLLEEGDLSDVRLLLLAQPRALTPQENVALDEWVRGGGRLLLFADPFLTAHSRFPLGDRRRPQGAVLLSPILAHWGLDLMQAEDAAGKHRAITLAGRAIPVDSPGHFRLRKDGACVLRADAVLAECTIGKGRAVILADAAVLDDPVEGSRAALELLLQRAFD